MVRLKAYQQYFFAKTATFQFHYGTIKSAKDIMFAIKINLFQFHYGTIKSEVGIYIKNRTIVSIPLWYD